MRRGERRKAGSGSRLRRWREGESSVKRESWWKDWRWTVLINWGMVMIPYTDNMV